jgi:CubicO group peptidase (beta-lactamase class C family)
MISLLQRRRHLLATLHRARHVTSLWLAALLLLPGGVLAQRSVDLAALDAYFARAQRDWPVPGFAVAIVKDGRIVFEKGYGLRDGMEGGEVDEHTLFAIASNTKAFTAATLGVLVDEGILSWDDRVVEHLPYFQLYDPFVTREMRIRDLLSHRSGLGSFSGDLLWLGTSYSAEEVVKRARYVPQAYPFRAGYGYSNLMFITAGEIIQAITGMTWAEFDRRHFFQPLDMSRTVTSTNALGAMENVATPHKNERGEVIPIEWYNWDAMGAGGGIISSVHDMSQWLLLQLEGGTRGGREYFSEGAQREMWTQHNAMAVSPGSQRTYPSTHFRGYGLGWGLMDYLGRKVISHGGGYDGMFSRVVLVPEEELGMVILTNSMTGVSTSLSYRILDAYLAGAERDWSAQGLESFRAGRRRFEARQDEAEEGRVSGTRPSLALSAYTGTYGGSMYGDATVSEEDGRLVLRLLPNPDLVADLTHLHYDTFLLRWRKRMAWFGKGTVQFLMDPSGEIVEMKMDVPNEDFWFHELELKRREQ